MMSVQRSTPKVTTRSSDPPTALPAMANTMLSGRFGMCGGVIGHFVHLSGKKTTTNYSQVTYTSYCGMSLSKLQHWICLLQSSTDYYEMHDAKWHHLKAESRQIAPI